MIGNSFRVLLTVCALTALGACAQSNSSADLSAAAPPPEPQVIEAEPPPPPAPPGRTKSAAAPSSRTKQAAPAAPPLEQQAALTPEEAKGKCWMRYENDKRAKSIDDRLKLVEKCVDDTMRGRPPQ